MTNWINEAFGNAAAVAEGNKFASRFKTPGDLANYIDHRIVNTPALDLIDDRLMDLMDTPDGRLIVSIAPQEGKSQRISRTLPLFMLLKNPNLRIAIVSYELHVARRWGREILRDMQQHPELGIRPRRDLKAQSEWQLEGYDGGVVTVGVGGALTGRAVDLLIIDDPIKDMVQAESETYRENVWAWWESVGSTRLSPGSHAVLVNTRWHEDDLAGRLIASEEGWELLNVPAQADHDPSKGEKDILGREPGEFLDSARKRTLAQWQTIKKRVGPRTWNALYQGNPAPTEGGTFKPEWWQHWESEPYFARRDGSYVVTDANDIIMSWDLTFKDTKQSDFVVGQVWMRQGIDCFLLDQVRERMDFVRTCAVIREMADKWPQAVLKLIEDKANGPAVIAQLNRTVPGIVPDNPRGSKEARAQAVTPLVESGHIFLPPIDPKNPVSAQFPWVKEFIHECKVFPNGKHDDQVDALSQGLNRIILQPLLAGTLVTEDDFDPDLDDERGWSISPI